MACTVWWPWLHHIDSHAGWFTPWARRPRSEPPLAKAWSFKLTVFPLLADDKYFFAWLIVIIDFKWTHTLLTAVAYLAEQVTHVLKVRVVTPGPGLSLPETISCVLFSSLPVFSVLYSEDKRPQVLKTLPLHHLPSLSSKITSILWVENLFSILNDKDPSG